MNVGIAASFVFDGFSIEFLYLEMTEKIPDKRSVGGGLAAFENAGQCALHDREIVQIGGGLQTSYDIDAFTLLWNTKEFGVQHALVK